MEFKDILYKVNPPWPAVDIATEWNLKYLDAGITLVENQVDIATEWNLKKAEEQVLQTKNKVDIETEWNLKN